MRLDIPVLTFSALVALFTTMPTESVARELPRSIDVNLHSLAEVRKVGELCRSLGYRADFISNDDGSFLARLGTVSVGSGTPPVCP